MKPRLLDLSRGGHMLIDEEDLHLVEGHSLYLGKHGYVTFSTNRTGPVLVHRLICPADPGMHVDHKDGDKLNNTRANLRAVSPQINQVNRKRPNRNNTSGHRGVSLSSASKRRPWLAQITVNRKNVYLGLFPTVEEAMAARIAAEVQYYGEECPR